MRFQARRETELKLSKNNVIFFWVLSMREKKLWEWWSVFTNDESFVQHKAGMEESCRTRQCAVAPKILLSRMENLEEENVMYELRNFLLWNKNFYGTFFTSKSFFFFLATRFTFLFREFFPRLSWWFDERARLSTQIQPCVHTAFLYSPCHSQRHTILTLVVGEFPHGIIMGTKKSSNAIKKTLAKHFSWNEAVKKSFFSVSIFFQPRPFLSADNEHELAIVLTRRELFFGDYKNKLPTFPSLFPHSKIIWKSEEKNEWKKNIEEIFFLYTTDFFLSCDSLSTRELLNWQREFDGLAAAKNFSNCFSWYCATNTITRQAVWLCKNIWMCLKFSGELGGLIHNASWKTSWSGLNFFFRIILKTN